jgi:Ca2+-binding EF-hand superfamily protein
MTKYLLIGAGATAMIGAAAMAQTPVAQPAPHAHVAKMQTRADVQSAVARHFARLDANRDGFVTSAEIDAMKAQHAQKRTDRLAQRAERRDPAKAFDRLDSNKDGQISRAEADAARAARAAKVAQVRANVRSRLFDRADANHDGIITRAEFDAVPHRPHMGMRMAGMHRGFGAHMFTMADLNKDGRVSLAEAQQLALQHFDRADLNHDGTLTPEERRQARQQLRAQRHPS